MSNVYEFGFLSSLAAIHFPTGTTGTNLPSFTDITLQLQQTAAAGGSPVPGTFTIYTFSSPRQSNLITAPDIANRMGNFATALILDALPGGSAASLVIKMDSGGSGAIFSAAMQIGPKTSLTITNRQVGPGAAPPQTTTYPVDLSGVPGGFSFIPSNIVAQSSSQDPQWLVVPFGPQSNGKFVIDFKHAKWKLAAPT